MVVSARNIHRGIAIEESKSSQIDRSEELNINNPIQHRRVIKNKDSPDYYEISRCLATTKVFKLYNQKLAHIKGGLASMILGKQEKHIKEHIVTRPRQGVRLLPEDQFVHRTSYARNYNCLQQRIHLKRGALSRVEVEVELAEMTLGFYLMN